MRFPTSKNHPPSLQASLFRPAETIVQLLAGAVRHHSLYPEDHQIARRHLDKIFTAFQRFFTDQKVLHLDVAKNRLLFMGETVHEGREDETDLAFLLGRDGIEWIEFVRDLEKEEIRAFLRVINANRLSDLENDGNIATGLWEADLPHIEHKTIDLMAMDLPLFDPGRFRLPPGPEGDDSRTARKLDGQHAPGQDDVAEPDTTEGEPAAAGGELQLSLAGEELWQLSSEERNQLALLVRREEEGPDLWDAMEILFLLLVLEKDRQEAAEILNFLQDRLLLCLQKHRFTLAVRTLRTLKKIQRKEQRQRQWLKPLVSSFCSTVSQPAFLRDLETYLSDPATEHEDRETTALWTFLEELPSNVAPTLARLSQLGTAERFKTPLLVRIQRLCTTDPGSVAVSAHELTQEICLELIPFLHTIPTTHSIPVLTALALHPADKVRGRAFTVLDQWDAVDAIRLFPLIDDPDKEIRSRLLTHLSARRDTRGEELLLAYLRHGLPDWGLKDPEHLLSCYQALGRVGSQHSLGFLEERLQQTQSLGRLFSRENRVHRQGALRALKELHLPEARAILRREGEHG